MSITLKMCVESYDVQPNGNIKISSLLKMLQKAAGDDVNKTELDYFSLAEKNIAFVLTKMTVEILQEIKVYDELTIVSHPRKTHGASFPRDFIIMCDGQLVAKARSIWVLLDLEKRTILRPSAVESMGGLSPSDEDAFEICDVRRMVDENSLLRTNVLEVEYSHLDMNNHLNNTYYADFIFDTLSKLCAVSASNKGLYLQINYKNEARYNDTLEIYSCADKENNEFDFCAKNVTNDKLCFTAYIKY